MFVTKYEKVISSYRYGLSQCKTQYVTLRSWHILKKYKNTFISESYIANCFPKIFLIFIPYTSLNLCWFVSALWSAYIWGRQKWKNICILMTSQLINYQWLIYSLPGSSVHEILLARILEWVVISTSKGSFWPQGLNPCFLWLLNWQSDFFNH